MRYTKLFKQNELYDKKLLLISLLLTCVGLIVLADASAPLAERSFADKFFFVKQQIVWAFAGIILLFVVSKIRYTFWEKIATPLFFITLVGLLAVFLPGLGAKFLGAHRWIIIGSISFQPSEFVKLSLALYIAKVASSKKKAAAFFVPLILTSFLIMLQPDLGTTIVLVAMAMVQIFVSGINMFYISISAFLGIMVAFILTVTSPYRRERLLTFFEQTRDPLGQSYHIRQILLALGSGGLFGVGLGQSRQKYLFLPETATDSIFAVVAEEVGFLGASLLIAIYVILILRGLAIARKAPDTFSRVLSSGIIAWIGGQAFLNIASMLAIVPLTGIPLPFLSYGGSSLTTILIAVGILLNISKYAKEK